MRSVSLAAVVAVLAASLAAPSSAAPSSAAEDPGAASSPVARGLIVSSDVPAEGLEESAQEQAEEVGPVEVVQVAELTDDLRTVRFDEPVPYDDAAEIADALADQAGVEWAVPDGRVVAQAASPVTPDDPLFGSQLQLWDGAASAAGGYSTKAPAFWRTSRGAGVVVAVLDTGITQHTDLRRRTVPGYDIVGADRDAAGRPLPAGHPDRYYTANDGDGRDPDATDPGDWVPAGDARCHGLLAPQVDSSWHGTHVAGIIAAEQNNGTGISGIAPDARVQSVRVLGRCGGWDSDVLAGITWASGGSVAGLPRNPTPAAVLNLSLGSEYASASAAASACRAYDTVLDGARSRGSVTVVAAGNASGPVAESTPAACRHVVAVAATGRSGRPAVYTNRGSAVDVAAFGGDASRDGSAVLSTIDTGATTPAGSGYARRQGTSMATPAVAGAAALLRSAGVPASSVETVLRRSVQAHPTTGGDVCGTSTCGAGVLDLSRVPVTVGLTVKTTRRAYGSGASYPVSVRIDGRHPAKGRVELRRGSTVLARATLSKDGTARLKVKGTAWRIGRNDLRVVHQGGRRSSVRTVTVTKATPTVRMSVPSTVGSRTRARMSVRVTAAGVSRPSGRLDVYDGRRRIASATLTSAQQGRRTIVLPRLARGDHRLRVVYTGSSTVAKKSSAGRTVRSR